MRKFFLVVSLLLATIESFACLSASQNRMFPLGHSPKGLFVIETHLRRTEYFDKQEQRTERLVVGWLGLVYLKIYDRNHRAVYTQVIDTLDLFHEKEYENLVGKSFQKGLSLAKSYDGFVAAKPVRMTVCDFMKNCSDTKLKLDQRKKIQIQLRDKTVHELDILNDSTSIAGNFYHYKRSFNDAELSASALFGRLYIGSVREFSIDGKKLTIVHIASGSGLVNPDGTQEYPPGKTQVNQEFRELEKSVFEEQVIHHGNGFDFFIWSD